jgi:uncharacterized membrane protein
VRVVCTGAALFVSDHALCSLGKKAKAGCLKCQCDCDYTSLSCYLACQVQQPPTIVSRYLALLRHLCASAAQGEALPSIQQNPSLPYKAIAALASLGTAETVYLTSAKLLQADVACPTSGCESVLASDYATLFGQPLSLYGMMAYVTVASLAVYADRQQAQQQEVAQPVNMALTAGVTLLASCSAFLM